jgi:hypothetical protein
MERPAVIAGPFSMADSVENRRLGRSQARKPDSSPAQTMPISDEVRPRAPALSSPLTGKMPTSRGCRLGRCSHVPTRRIGLHLALQAEGYFYSLPEIRA